MAIHSILILPDNNDDDDDDENQVQLKSAPINRLSATQHTTTMRTNSTEITKLTTSIESVRSSVLQA